MSDLTDRPQSQIPGETSLEVNFALTLSRLIDEAQTDPAQLRHTVYQLARVKLREQFGREDAKDISRMVDALESAIQGVEEFSRRADPNVPTLQAPEAARDAGQSESGVSVSPRDPSEGGVPTQMAEASRYASTDADKITPTSVAAEPESSRSGWGPQAWLIRFVLVAAILTAGVAVALNWSRIRDVTVAVRPIAEKVISTGNLSAPAERKPTAGETLPVSKEPEHSAASPPPPDPGFPVPTNFGVYALDGDQLVELKAIPGRVPDMRVAISAAINTPSEASISGAQPRFIVFRRDLVASAPDAAQLRIMAQVTRVAGADPSGKPASRSPDGWVIRNIAVPYKVGPVEGRPEMILLQPETEGRPLPGGRYALVIKGQGFDFNIEGPVNDPQHCLQRFNSTNGAFYAPCPER